MIRRLQLKDKISFYEFVNRCNDCYFDFYVTIEKERKFPKENLKLIEKLLKYQETYAVEEKEIKGILLIYRSKGFRLYIKILVEKIDFAYDLLKYLNWNFSQYELYAKFKKENPITRIAQLKNKLGFPKYGFGFYKSRGQEVLLIHKKQEKK
jgi:hypothetical protein